MFAFPGMMECGMQGMAECRSRPLWMGGASDHIHLHRLMAAAYVR